MNAALIDALQAACDEVGIVFKEVPHDGQWHPTDVEGDRQDSGAGRIKIFPDGEGGIVFNWKWGESRPFFANDDRVLTKEERAERDRKRQEAVRQAEAEAAAALDRAAEEARRQWAKCQPASEFHSYLRLKGVKPHGILQKPQRSPGNIPELVVPVKSCDVIQSLQFIGPDGKKRFLPRGKVTGGYYALGDPKGADALCIAEGFATGASIHEATNYPVAVAFNAGKLGAVAKAMREKFRDMTLILCADDDFQTEGNPGLTKATEAARAVCGLLAVPDFSAVQRDGATDFNDLARLCGAEAVKACIANASQCEEVQSDGGEGGAEDMVPGREGRPAFRVFDDWLEHGGVKYQPGVWHFGTDKDGRPTQQTWVCTPLHIDAVTFDGQDNNYGRLLRFKNVNGRWREWPMPMELLAGLGNEIRAELLAMAWVSIRR